MKREDAKKYAETRVYVYMNLRDIEEACQARGIKVTRDRSKMETKLIESLVNDLCSEDQTGGCNDKS